MRLSTATIPKSIVYFLDSPYRSAKRFCIATSLATPIQVGPAPARPRPFRCSGDARRSRMEALDVPSRLAARHV